MYANADFFVIYITIFVIEDRTFINLKTYVLCLSIETVYKTPLQPIPLELILKN